MPVKTVLQKQGYFLDAEEVALAEHIEREAHAAIRRVRRRGALEPRDHVPLTKYLLALVARSETGRAIARAMYPKVLTDLIAESRRFFNAVQDARSTAAVDRIHEKFRERMPPETEDQAFSPFRLLWSAPMLLRMHWTVVETRDAELVLGDSGVVWTTEIGIGHAESQLALPLTPASVLHLSASKRDIRSADGLARPWQAKEINRAEIRYAHRFVIAAKRLDWLPRAAENHRRRKTSTGDDVETAR